jgi:hypothetical protein
VVELTADWRRREVAGRKQQSGPCIGCRICLCKPQQSGIPIDTNAGNVRNSRGETQQCRSRSGAALQNTFARTGGNGGRKQHGIDGSSEAVPGLHIRDPPTQEMVLRDRERPVSLIGVDHAACWPTRPDTGKPYQQATPAASASRLSFDGSQE